MKKPIVLFILLLILAVLQFSLGYSSVAKWDVCGSIRSVNDAGNSLYEVMRLRNFGLSQKAFNFAITGLNKLTHHNGIHNSKLITVVDFSKPSNEKRLFVIDLEKQKVLFNTYVAHGQNSGKQFANRFSNKPESFQSSLGFYQTMETYYGKHGYSLKLSGLEAGINDRAEQRAIVIHAAPYVSEQYIRTKGYLGRSWGCPAIPEKLNKQIIDQIKNGSCLFIYGNDPHYERKSAFIHS